VASSYWVLIAILVILDLTFTMVRSSLLQVRPAALNIMKERFPRAAERTLRLLEHPHLRITLRTAPILMHFLLPVVTWYVIQQTGLVSKNFEVLVGFALFFAFVLLLVEFGLEALVRRNRERWAMRMTFFGYVIDLILRPYAWLVSPFQGQQVTSNPDNAEMEEELKNWMASQEAETSLAKNEHQMISSILDFGDTLCREIMVPRIDIFALEVNTSVQELIPKAVGIGHSRVPVFDEEIDNIVGLLYVKDLLLPISENKENTKIRELLRPAYFIPEAKKVNELMREMQEKGIHIAIVVDEYGGTAGLVTLEDIMEEIVGEIRDEYDTSEEAPYQKLGVDEYIFLGGVGLEDLNELLGTNLNKEVADTLAGFIYGEIGRVPVEGEKVEMDGWILEVQQVVRRRIRKVHVYRPPTSETEET
jgi:putative hemolysin